jgi:type VI secretion system VasD/TssJ family lipoprotein
MTGLYAKDAGLSTPPATCRALLHGLLCCLLCLAGLVGCGDKQPPKPTLEAETPDNILWPYGSKAITLHLNADKDLNAYQSKAHSLQLCVYQLDKREAFDKLVMSDGLATLLQCGLFDPSVKASTRIFLQPDEDAVHILNRAEGTVLVGIVCGFFDSTTDRSVGVWSINPKVTKSGMLFWKSTSYSAGTLDLSLHLSANAMEEDSLREKRLGLDAETIKKKHTPPRTPVRHATDPENRL